MRTTLVTGPAVLPITLAEVKEHLHIDSSDATHDAYINALILAATGYVEQITRRRLITQTWKYFLDAWPPNYIELPYGRLQSVTGVYYTDSGDTLNTMDTDEYTVDTDSDPGRVVLDYGESWPGDALATSNPIYVQYVCGYGAHTQQATTAATNAAPIVVTIVGHGYSSGDQVRIDSITGNTNANGTWTIARLTADTFSLLGSSGNAAYVSGGTAYRIDVPGVIRQGILLYVSELFERREMNVQGTILAPNRAIEHLLAPYRIMRF